MSSTEENYDKFSNSFPGVISNNVASLRGKEQLVQSYARVAAMNAVKVDLFSQYASPGAASFFSEAHNDALVSHVNASFGSWRTSLQALRSFLENTLAAIYYMDHPVELQKWQAGKFWISPKELREYVSDHPVIGKLSTKSQFVQSLNSEYAELSKAVHGSNPLFRMSTSDGLTNFGSASLADLGKWSTRERASFNICTTLIVGVFAQYLDGAKLPALRDALSNCVPETTRTALRTSYSVNLGGS